LKQSAGQGQMHPTARAGSPEVAGWLDRARQRVKRIVGEFVDVQCARYLDRLPSPETFEAILVDFVTGGKFLRSTFAHIGLLCGADAGEQALRAAGSVELVHAFALLQDDVMDDSALRRGRPTAHVRLNAWHADRGAPGPGDRFGRSAAILLGDLCLAWSGQLLHTSGMGQEALQRAWPYYDAMLGELAVGQVIDLLNDSRCRPSFAQVLDVARRKSGDYTVRRPLELGAALAGCGAPVVQALTAYGGLVGEAFQLRDDLLGVFGDASTTGKPTGQDLRERKATSVVVLARELAEPAVRQRMDALMCATEVTEDDTARWQELIAATGADERIEELIRDRVTRALHAVHEAPLTEFPCALLHEMAIRCAQRCN
jgi:geranylgeranyl diphosphate synthase type I